jgi:aminoglycoside phosphotransferase (APT) family kinase protein
VVHRDPGPFNAIFQEGLPTAFIDWSSCRPGDWLDDLGYLAWTWCIQSRGHVPIAEQARHLRALHDGYGDTEPEILLAAMMGSQTRIVDLETANADNPRHSAARRRHEALLLSALR